MNISFENKVALVTGAGSGLGLATAKAFAESGASVALADWNEKAVRSATEELAAQARRKEFISTAQAPMLRVPFADGTLVATADVPSDDLIPSLLAASDVLGTGWFARGVPPG